MGVVTRGEVRWVDLGEPVGSEPAYRRPALIVSSDRFNRSRISTVLVSAITSNMRLATAPGNVELIAGSAGLHGTGLNKDCVVNVSQTLVVDRSRLGEPTGTLDVASMRRVDDGLRLVLDL